VLFEGKQDISLVAEIIIGSILLTFFLVQLLLILLFYFLYKRTRFSLLVVHTPYVLFEYDFVSNFHDF